MASLGPSTCRESELEIAARSVVQKRTLIPGGRNYLPSSVESNEDANPVMSSDLLRKGLLGLRKMLVKGSLSPLFIPQGK